MYSVTRWSPFREMDELQKQFPSLLGLAPLRRMSEVDKSITAAEWSPLVDVIENDKEYLIKADLPDLDKTDVNVRVENGVLYLSGERKQEKEEKGKRVHRVERYYGNFVRSFTIPDDADTNKVNAEFKNGVLTIHLAKSEQAKPRRIEIKFD